MKLTLLVFFLGLNLQNSSSQNFEDRINTNISFFSSAATDDKQNFWFVSNSNGIFDETSKDLLALLGSKVDLREEKYFDVGGGIELLSSFHRYSHIRLQQAYVETQIGLVHLKIGAKNRGTANSIQHLSSGSLAISNNARPIPRVSIEVPEYYTVPNTNGWLEFRGHFSHGWLSDERHVKGAFFHDKSVFLQTGAHTGVKFYTGLSHFAIWGGESKSKGILPSGFTDFFRVIMARKGDSNAPSNELNALGFHTGVWEWGIKSKVNNTDMHFYYEHLFTDGSGLRYKNLGDGLFGVKIKNPFGIKWISYALYEFLNTKNQSGPGLNDDRGQEIPDFCDQENCGYEYGGRDNYYNNSIYLSGFSHGGRAIGNPFFLTANQLNEVAPDVATYSSAFFVSTRNLAHHFGLAGDVSETLSYKVLASYVEYHGTYHGRNFGTKWGSLDPERNSEEYFFYPPQIQWYYMLKANWSPESKKELLFSVTLGADKGDMFNEFGLKFGVSYSIRSAGLVKR